MRIRRRPWARQELAEAKFFVDDPLLNLGKWHKAFKNKKNPMHLELRMW
jgi:tRNA G46 methylase TrmB